MVCPLFPLSIISAFHRGPRLSVALCHMNFQSVCENVVAAVLSAILLASIAWLLSWVRNLLLERKLKDAIAPNGVGIGFDQNAHKGSFSLQIHNYANATIRVRAIVFMADKFHVELRPSQDKPIYQTPLSNEIVRPKFKRTHLSKGSIEPDNNLNAMLLPPKTMGFWEVPSDVIGTREWKVADIYMVFEYATIFGNSALVRMKATNSTLQLVKENFERLSIAAHNKQPFDFFHGLKHPTHEA